MLLVALLLTAASAQADHRAEAEGLARAGAHAEALRQFERLAADNPQDLDLRVWIARLHYWTGALEAAEQEYRAIVAREREHVDALFERFSSDQLGRFDANTALAGVRVAFPSVTWLFVTYEHQQRRGGVTMGRVAMSLVQSF